MTISTFKGGETIYRQDAIEAIKSLPRWVMDANGEFQPVDPPTVSMLDPEDAVSAIENLPSAQPEIIHCGDCKYKDDGIDEDGIPFLKCLNGRSYGGTRINDFCSWAERRTDDLQ